MTENRVHRTAGHIRRQWRVYAAAGVCAALTAACGAAGSGSPSAGHVRSGASSAAASARTLVDRVAQDPGGANFERAANACPPTTGNAVTSIVLVDTSSMSWVEKGSVWGQRAALAAKFKGHTHAWVECLKTQLKLTQAQKSKFDSCLKGKALNFNYHGLTGLKAIWNAVQGYVVNSLLHCYDHAAGLQNTASSGEGNHSPPSSPSPSGS